MKKKHLVAGVVAAFVLVSCGDTTSGGDGVDRSGIFGGGGDEEKAQEEKEQEKKPPVQVQYPTGINAPCESDGDCDEGYTCKSSGTCQIVCTEHADCGNGKHCRSGECKKDCSGVTEKCSNRRPCCFFDDDGDKQTDVSCIPDEKGDDRCLVE